MCIEASIMWPGDENYTDYSTMAELAAVMPNGIVFDLAYFTPPLTPEEIMGDGNRCLCPVDFEATAERNGYTVYRTDDCMFMVFEKILWRAST